MTTLSQNNWAPHVVLVDAEYLNQLVFDLSVQLERILGRAVPALDIAKWAEYICLDGGLRPGNNHIQVLLLYRKYRARLNNLLPSNLAESLDGKACASTLGELQFASFPVEDSLVARGDLFVESTQTLLSNADVQTLLLVGDMNAYGNALVTFLRGADLNAAAKSLTVFVMQTLPGLRYPQEFLSYSLMAALGISSEELP